MEKKYLTIRQAAKIIGVSELTLRNWDKSRKFVASRHPMNNYRIYTLDQVENLMKKLGLGKPTKKLVIKVLED
ncbi:MerR family transcriptional regulator [Candidatus Giovannonibacteria bacterium]|nr:MerR family transcriptional regulator [Candidatus Giovannonibacteria bacterium]